MTALNDIRSAFLAFFGARDHTVVGSAPLVPQNDPTLMFVNAGMVPFKNVFVGVENRPYGRAVSAQKCVRAGGKHNDLDNVGYTARHHTFFEMLGNFSFGDYFKEEAIDAAWTLVSGTFELPRDRLVVTVFHDDDEAADLWRRIAGLDERRIIRIATQDNFWSMGDTGPCGPCSEIFYDHGAHIPGGPPGSPDEDGDRFVEIWNLVFMQFDRQPDGALQDLPKPSIDTGMGLERIAAVLQGVHDNYEIDLFAKLIGEAKDVLKAPPENDADAGYRVIADHLRAACFLMADGVTPANEGRGYVLRRIMRRAMRYAHALGGREPIMAPLAPVLIGEMGGAYPELARAEASIVQTLRAEEVKFNGLLERGTRLLDDAASRLPQGAALPGEVAFKLYDTYGFPLDLTQDALRRYGRTVDVDGFEQAMAAQREAARAAWRGSGQEADEAIWFDVGAQAGATDFLGYVHDAADAVVQAIVKDGAQVDAANAGDAVEIVANQTPFYAEAGGQIGDAGRAAGADGLLIEIADVKKRQGLHIHVGKVVHGTVTAGATVRLEIDRRRREAIRSNHSATHLLHSALRRTLGPHVAQKGSLVAHDRLRFDFSHPSTLTDDERDRIERDVNAVIRQNDAVRTEVMSYDDAVEAGAMALFGEKYEADVRVLTMGRDVGFGDDADDGGDNGGDAGADGSGAYSMELCGGTHVTRTGDVGLFVIVSESAVASGVRRIEALTGESARRHMREEAALAARVAQTLNTPPREVPGRVAALVDERRKLERALAEAKKALALGGGAKAEAPGPKDVGGVAFVGSVLQDVEPKVLRGLVDEQKRAIASGVVAYIGVREGKAALAVGVTDDLTDAIDAVALVRAGAAAV
ncbi:MAG: alanine--tRNA ligase, partial [Pseudomonadota bacterium]